ncbi:MAG TPA: hypothetical protein VE127_01780, partial [Solirubrobacteraceae bacterium]|nr:hypothetical protein [Solirubrobacteraceae bacterium]
YVKPPPRAVGSIACLIANELALAEVCHRWLCLRRRDLPWWSVAPLLMPESATEERRALDARLPAAHVHAPL